jgi:hypothetical protein
MTASKPFKVASISTNMNSFGLYGHILMAEDGESWQVGRSRSGGDPAPWEKGEIVEVPVVVDPISQVERLDWEQLHCEVPQALADAPANVVAEIWGHAIAEDEETNATIPKKELKPSIIFSAEQFTPTEWNTAQDKADFANHFVRFVESGFSVAEFSPEFYNRLSQTFGHIAHFDRGTFFKKFFTSSADKVRFLRQAVDHESFGDAQFTFCDVERVLREWIIQSKTMERIEQTAIHAQNRAEREQLKKLLKKHGMPEDSGDQAG